MRFQNKRLKDKSNTHALEVSCAHCKTPVLIYQKGGNGGLIKIQIPRVIEAMENIWEMTGELTCPKCGASLAKRGEYQERPTFWVTRGQINTTKLSRYQYPK